MFSVHKFLALVFIFFVSVHAATAAEWEFLPEDNSAILAADLEWNLVSSTAMSWPDGRQALITFWDSRLSTETEVRILVRCIDYFNDSMQSTGGNCKAPRN